ncbi:uncharacterized protein [Watersipora subatra]|uniref:uncharacterized protein n=1 Tax=Watersipora subatra TaxID=2589382 RepID=UPI00355C9999
MYLDIKTTVHQPLEVIFKKLKLLKVELLKAPKRLQAMIMHLQRYSFQTKYLQEVHQVTAAMLFRSQITNTESSEWSNQQLFQVLRYQEICPTFEIDTKVDRRVTDQIYTAIQEATVGDTMLTQLKTASLEGWPATCAGLSPELTPYWTFKEELAVLDGIIYKGTKIVIPKLLRRNMLERLHVSHQRTAATLRRARQVVYWLDMTEDNKQRTEL